MRLNSNRSARVRAGGRCIGDVHEEKEMYEVKTSIEGDSHNSFK